MGTDGNVLKKGELFTAYVIKKIKTDNAFGAALRRADNPDTEYQAWEYLVPWCNIEKPWERLPFVVVAASLARAKPEKDGTLGIGKCIAACYEDGQKSDAAKAKLRRLLACNSIEETCRVLRSALSLIQSRGIPLGYGALLDQLLWFGSGERQKLRWASDFYGRRGDDDSHNA